MIIIDTNGKLSCPRAKGEKRTKQQPVWKKKKIRTPNLTWQECRQSRPYPVEFFDVKVVVALVTESQVFTLMGIEGRQRQEDDVNSMVDIKTLIDNACKSLWNDRNIITIEMFSFIRVSPLAWMYKATKSLILELTTEYKSGNMWRWAAQHQRGWNDEKTN